MTKPICFGILIGFLLGTFTGIYIERQTKTKYVVIQRAE